MKNLYFFLIVFVILFSFSHKTSADSYNFYFPQTSEDDDGDGIPNEGSKNVQIINVSTYTVYDGDLSDYYSLTYSELESSADSENAGSAYSVTQDHSGSGIEVLDFIDTTLTLRANNLIQLNDSNSLNVETITYDRVVKVDMSDGSIVEEILVASSQEAFTIAQNAGYTVMLAESAISRSGADFQSLTTYSSNVTNSSTDTANVDSDGGFVSEKIVGGDGAILFRQESDGTVHIGENSIVLADESISSSGYDEIYSSSGTLVLGNSTSDNTSVNGNMTVTGSFSAAAYGTNSLASITTGSGNTALGTSSLYSTTTGINNSVIGYESGYSNVSGNYNTANGYQTLYSSSVASYNTATGFRSQYATTTGEYNSSYGYNSMLNNTTGENNTAIGAESMKFNTTGSNNTALGQSSLNANTTGYKNVAVGTTSLALNTTGYQNTAVGYNSLLNNTTGYQNTAIGEAALYSNTTGVDNSAVGQQALYSNTTGVDNAALGSNALYSNTTGSDNTAIGHNSLWNNSTGNRNTSLGQQTMYYNTTGASNTALGTEALVYNTTGSYNTALGDASLSSNTTGTGNVTLGYGAGFSNTTGSNNVFIGYKAGYNETGSNKLYIDNSDTTSPLIYGDFDADAVTINGNMTVTGSLAANTITDSSGNSIMSRDSSTGAIHIGQNSMVFDDSGGSVGNGTDIMSSSAGKIQIGKNNTDTTTFVGKVNVPDPTTNSSATNRKYVDSVALMASVLDTRRPAYGKKSTLSLSSAYLHGQAAHGLNFVGIIDKWENPIDISLGLANSTSETMGKASIGFSW